MNALFDIIDDACANVNNDGNNVMIDDDIVKGERIRGREEERVRGREGQRVVKGRRGNDSRAGGLSCSSNRNNNDDNNNNNNNNDNNNNNHNNNNNNNDNNHNNNNNNDNVNNNEKSLSVEDQIDALISLSTDPNVTLRQWIGLSLWI